MIENLNKQSFSGYGTVLRDSLPNRGFPTQTGWTERVRHFSANELFYYRTPAPLYLDFELGMTVLALRAQAANGAKPTCFYLDKPVCLPVGTEFAIVPYQQECSVRMSLPDGQELEELEPCGAIRDLKIADHFSLGEIYTLFYREEESGFLFKGERHSMLELTYVDRGQLHCVVDGNGYTLRQGQLMIFMPEQWHMQYTDLNVTARFLTIAFDLTGDVPLSYDGRIYELSSEEAMLLTRLLKETELNDPYSDDLIRCNLKLLLMHLLRDTGSRKKRLKTPLALHNENFIVGRTLQYISDHVYDKLSVEIVAHETGVSASHLTALFRRQMGISPGEYIRRVKLEESKALIREGKMNFSKIAAALNYSTIHHFSRQFKDHFGVSPSEYAKSIRTE